MLDLIHYILISVPLLDIHFEYSIQGDAKNILLGLSAINSRIPTTIEESFLDFSKGDTTLSSAEAFVEQYLLSNSIRPQQSITSFSDTWLSIARSFEERMEVLFQVALPSAPLTAFLTINTRCTYSTTANRFYIYWATRAPGARIMHEIFHFYTHYGVMENRPQLLESSDWNNLKESLTVVLNMVCSDLLGGTADKGYSQHVEIRNFIRQHWLPTQDIYVLIDHLILSGLISSF